MSNCTNSTVISRGIFGRLSCLSIDRETLVNDLMLRRKKEHYDDKWEEQERSWFLDKGIDIGIVRLIFRDPAPVPITNSHLTCVKSSVPKVLTPFIDELNSLVESIVLCDEIKLLRGFKLCKKNKLRELTDFLQSDLGNPLSKDLILNHPGSTRLIHYPDEANHLQALVVDNVKTTSCFSVDRKAFDTTFLSGHFHDNNIVIDRAQAEAFSEVDYDGIIQFVKNVELAGESSATFGLDDRDSAEYIQWFSDFLANFRGDEFLKFRNTLKSKMDSFPNEYYFSRFNPPLMKEWVSVSKLMYLLSLYEEVSYAAENSHTVIPSWGGREFYSSLLNLHVMKMHDVANIVTTKYRKTIEEELKEKGLSSFNISMPQVLSACSIDANSIDDIILNAVNIRKMKWAKNLRKYIKDLVYSDNPAMLLHSMNKLDSYIERAVKGKTPTGFGNITFSSNGTASVSVNEFFCNIQARRHPVLMFNAHLYKKFFGRDVIRNLSSIFHIDASEIVKFYNKDT